MRRSPATRAAAVLAAAFLALAAPDRASADAEAVSRGAYVFAAGGCAACHTDRKGGGAPLAGGAALPTPFGTFYAPNITPDPQFGIGRWSDQDFLRAMRRGIAPDGRPYYPVFPFTSYTRASERDLLDLKAYLFAQPAVARPSRAHELRFPFSVRAVMWPWRWLNFAEAHWRDDPAKPAVVNRGAYLVEALAHCGECHTPRDRLGATIRGQWLSGARFGAGDSLAPNLTPHQSGLASWKESDIAYLLEYGVTPDGEAMGGEMAEVIENGTSKLTAADRAAIAAYLKALPPLPSAVARPASR